MLTNRPKTKLLVDGGDTKETLRMKSSIGFVDGQTCATTARTNRPAGENAERDLSWFDWSYPADLSSDVGAVGCFQNTTYHLGTTHFRILNCP